jgi:hypothetical protein
MQSSHARQRAQSANAVANAQQAAHDDAKCAAQADLVEVVHTLRQVVCVKG